MNADFWRMMIRRESWMIRLCTGLAVLSIFNTAIAAASGKFGFAALDVFVVLVNTGNATFAIWRRAKAERLLAELGALP